MCDFHSDVLILVTAKSHFSPVSRGEGIPPADPAQPAQQFGALQGDQRVRKRGLYNYKLQY